ncbi:MAG: Crp/Fnr family transcriptional regulator [Lentimicrobium sp.]
MTEFLINRISNYIDLSEQDIRVAESLFVKEQYKANDIIHSEGKVCRHMWFIAKGLVRFSINTDGEDRTFIFRNEGNFISDIEGFIKHIPATKSIIAIEDCEMYSISKANMQRFFREVTNGERFGRLLVEDVFVAAVNHIVSFYTENPETRYIRLLNQNKDFIQRIPQYHIASFLGIKPQSLCRIKKRLLASDL